MKAKTRGENQKKNREKSDTPITTEEVDSLREGYLQANSAARSAVIGVRLPCTEYRKSQR